MGVGGVWKLYVETMLVVLLGMMWLLLIGITPSIAQPQDDLGMCWGKVVECWENHANQSALDPKFDKSSPSFNATEFLCCSLIQVTAQISRSCFCTVDTMIHRDPQVGSDVLRALILCNVTDSLPTLDAFCSSLVASAPPGSNSTLSPPLVASPPPASGATPSRNPETPNSPQASGLGPRSSPARKGKIKVIIGIVVPSAIPVVVLIAIGTRCYCTKTKRKPVVIAKFPNPDDIITIEALQYDLGILQAATNNFSNDRKIGQGGFGVVYKGTFANGQDIAVKRLSKSSGQGDKEFKNEVVLLANLRHRNLVRLLGFCLAGDEELLVYEFVPNKSLDYFLFDPQKQAQLNWHKRYNITRGIARGMLYLHEDSPARIIHRDLKAANILLDAEMNPKVADFGLGRIFDFEETHISTSRVVGTYGYMAPEYLIHGRFSAKSDVYGFGVLVLEVVSGRRNGGLIYQSEVGQNLLSYAWKCWEDGRPLELMDPKLKDSYSEEEVIRCIHLGLLCVQEDINKRPTMAKIMLMLDSYSAAGPLSSPQRPLFVSSGSTDLSITTGSNGS